MNYTDFRDVINRKLGKVNRLRPLFEFAQGLDFGTRYVCHRFLGLDAKSASTREIYVEWVNYCNLRCSFCALNHEMVKTRMSSETWSYLLNELIYDKRFKNVELMHLHNGGETLLHPKFSELLFVLDEKKIEARENKKKFPKVELLTNGMLLDGKHRSAILNSSAIDSVGLSMDGGSPEAYESMRKRAKWSVFYPQVKAFLEENAALAKPKAIFIISVLPTTEMLEKKDFHPEFAEILYLCPSYELRLAHDWGGQVDLEGIETGRRSKPWKWGCSMMLDQLVVMPNGDVSICCNDLNAKAVVANIHENGLYAAYHSPMRQQWLNSMARNRSSDIPLCASCERF